MGQSLDLLLKLIQSDLSYEDKCDIMDKLSQLREPKAQQVAKYLLDADRPPVALMRAPEVAWMLNQSGESVEICDLQFRYLFVNHAFETMTGYCKDEALGESIAMHGGGLQSADNMAKIRDHLEAGKSWKGELIARKKNGGLYHCELAVSPVEGPDGTIDHYMMVRRDLSKQTNASREKEDLQRQLFQAAKMVSLGTMAAGIAHELRNPLTAVKGYAQMIIKHPDHAATVVKRAEAIHRASDRMDRIVQHLKNFAHDGKTSHTFSQIAINDPIQDALVLLAGNLKDTDINVNLSLSDNLPLIWADPIQLETVIQNLISNSRDAFMANRINGDRVIEIGTMRRAQDIVIHYRDNAGGMPADVKARLFDPFFTTKSIGVGTGLGMSICLRAIERHRGSIKVDSSLGMGTHFVIRLPIQLQPTVEEEEERLDALEDLRLKPSAQQKPELLIADGDRIVVELMVSILGDAYQITAVSSCAECLESAKRHRFDVVLCDIALCGEEGTELIHALQKGTDQPPAIIMMSNFKVSNDVTQRWQNEGAHAFIVKPFDDVNSLRKIIRVAIRGERGGDPKRHPLQLA